MNGSARAPGPAEGTEDAGGPAEPAPAKEPRPARRRLLGLLSIREAVALASVYLAVTLLTHFRKVAGAVSLVVALALFARTLSRLLGGTLVAAWRRIEAASSRARELEREQAGGEVRLDLKPLVVLCTVAVVLTLIEYYGDRDVFERVATSLRPGIENGRYFELFGFAYWSFARFTGYVLIPLGVTLVQRGRFRDYGLSARGTARHLWIYVVLYLFVLPPVVMVSYTASFQSTYPFYKMAARSWGDFLAWEALYAVQFFALEVFFRGYVVNALERRLGAYAVFVMAVPYCMIHYHKPIPEVLGAIVAGLVLGTLSLATRSIWCGVLIHVSVAWTMDVLSLLHTSGLPGHSFVTSD